MLKKLAAICVLTLASSTVAQAGSFYIGPSLMLNYLSAKHSSYHSLSPRLSVGYGGDVVDNFYLAGEVTASPGGADLQNNYTKGTDENTKITHSYGISAIPGLKLSDTAMLYARLGAARSYFTNQNKNVVGGQAGLGIQVSMTPSWDIRGEYIRTAYRSVSADIGSPKSNAFDVGVIHTF
jgi:opacity protein-like surface antigen